MRLQFGFLLVLLFVPEVVDDGFLNKNKIKHFKERVVASGHLKFVFHIFYNVLLSSNVNDIKTIANLTFDSRKILISKQNERVYKPMIQY